MRTPDSHDHEWWQVVVVLGHYDSFEEAHAAGKEFQKRDDFAMYSVAGSWHTPAEVETMGETR